MEKTGVYSKNLDHYLTTYSQFHKTNYQIVLTHSFAVSRLRDVYSASLKTGPFDAYIIAEGLRMNVLRVCRKDKKYQQLQGLLERRENLLRRRTSIISQLRNQLVVCFPELDQTFDRLTSIAALAILEICPTSSSFLRTGMQPVLDHIRYSGGKIKLSKLENLYVSAQQSVASSDDEFIEFMVRNLVEELQSNIRFLKSVESELDHFTTQFDNELELLQSVPGIGKLTSYYFLSVIGHYKRFLRSDGSGAKHVASYLGFDLVEHSSGSKRHIGGISKRGDPLLRGKMYMAALTAIRVDKKIRSSYEAMAARNGSRKKAMVAVARLLARRCFGVLKSGILYDPGIPHGKSV